MGRAHKRNKPQLWSSIFLPLMFDAKKTMKCRNVPIIKSVRFPVGWMFLKFCPLFSDWLRCEWNEWNKTRPRQFPLVPKVFLLWRFWVLRMFEPRYFFNFGHPKIEYKNLIGISKNRWLRLIRPYKRACWWFIKPLITLYLIWGWVIFRSQHCRVATTSENFAVLNSNAPRSRLDGCAHGGYCNMFPGF